MSRASYILIHQSRAGTAFPPVRGGAPTMEEWARLRAARRPWWKRLFSVPRAASPIPHGARPSHIEAVEAGFDNGASSDAE
ncbi:hypothetical protein [Novosphingobium sp.]|uniref:hypothetical protein n=1 Tax=Novosphingobium sp. TaxID=1874826 RepID=UPI0026309D43|nr:hypothetical protein [Novosphingobium sp.]